MISGDAALASWQEQRSPGEQIFTTTTALSKLIAAAENMDNVDMRRRWLARLKDDVPAQFGPRLRSFDVTAAIAWGAMRLQIPNGVDFDELDLLSCSIAKADGLDFVTPTASWQAHVTGVVFHDPWT
jgi:hypothetical protein